LETGTLTLLLTQTKDGILISVQEDLTSEGLTIC
jgi:hypothetical protein